MIKTAVLFLEPDENFEGPSHDAILLSPAAGVPLLLRAVLSLQKAGVGRVFLQHSRDIASNIYDLIKDKRISLTIDWLDTRETPFNSFMQTCMSDAGQTVLLKPTIIFDVQKFKEAFSGRNIFCGSKIILLEKEGVFSASFSESNEKFKKTACAENDIVIAAIASESDKRKAETLIFRSLVNPSYGLIEKAVDRKISLLFTRFFIRTPVTPNQITVFSTLLGLSAVCFFRTGNATDAILGSLLFILSTIVDCTDGEVARLKFMESRFGSLLDIICDNIVQIPLFFSIAYGSYLVTGSFNILIVGVLAVIGSTLSFILIFYTMWIKEKREQEEEKRPGNELSVIEKREYSLGKGIDNLINRDFSYLILVCACFNMLDWFLVLTAIGSNMLWVIILIKKRKILFI